MRKYWRLAVGLVKLGQAVSRDWGALDRGEVVQVTSHGYSVGVRKFTPRVPPPPEDL